MIKLPDMAMVLSAGKGTRMGVKSRTLPKPLSQVLGKSLLDRILDHLGAVGIEQAVVNVHHLADQIEEHLSHRKQAPEIIISDERDALLGQGGGVEKALPHFKGHPFFAINSDALWVDEGSNALKKMASLYDPEKMDILLLVTPLKTAIGYDGQGDVFMDADGRLSWRGEADSAPYVYAGVQIITQGIFHDTPEGLWSLKMLYERAVLAGRLYGCVLDGHWMHVGTQDSITQSEQKLLSIDKEFV